MFLSGASYATPPSNLYIPDIENYNFEAGKDINYGFNKAVVEVIPIQVNLDAFNYVLADGNYKKIDNQLNTGQTFEFQHPFDNTILKLNVTKVEQLFPEYPFITYSGHGANDKNITFKFTISDKGVFGRLRNENYIYFIESDASLNGQHTLVIIDRRLIPYDSDDMPDGKEGETKHKNSNATNIKSGGNGNVRILVYYANNVIDGPSKAVTLVSDFNQALRNSQVNINNKLSFAGIKQLNSNLSGLTKHNIVDTYMPQRLGPFVNMDYDIAETGADIVFTIVNGPAGPNDPDFPGYYGIVGGKVSALFDSAKPFAVTADNYLGSNAEFTGIHEIGHLFKGYHPEYQASGSNRGYINIFNQNYYWQTIMGSYNYYSCQIGAPQTCHRIQYFSTPNLTHDDPDDPGDTAYPMGNSGHNMVPHLNVNMVTASNWRGAPIPKPSTPNNLTVTSAQCHGHNFVSWDAVSGADSYHLYRVNGSNNLVSLYSGTSTGSVFINVTSGTWPLKVKACNAAGCSPLSVAKNAHYVSYCM